MWRRALIALLAVAAVTPAAQVRGDVTDYVIYDAGKKGIEGIRLISNTDGVTIAETLNGTGTSGRIEQPAKCDAKHYHGTLYGKNDPYDTDKSDHCGWGKVVESSQASDLLAHLSNAVMEEFRAAREIVAGSADLDEVSADCASSIEELRLAKAEVEAELTAKEAEPIIKSLDRAISKDKACIDAANNGKSKDALKALKDGLDAKARAFNKINKHDGLLP